MSQTLLVQLPGLQETSCLQNQKNQLILADIWKAIAKADWLVGLKLWVRKPKEAKNITRVDYKLLSFLIYEDSQSFLYNFSLDQFSVWAKSK